MKRILILNLSATGHHPRYNRWVLDSEAWRDADLIVAGRSELFEHAVLKDTIGKIQCHRVLLSQKQEAILGDTSSTAALMRRQFALWSIWRQTFDDVNLNSIVDLVFMLSADDCLDAVALRGSPFGTAPWMGIALKPTFHFRRMGITAPKQRYPALREWLFRRVLRNRFLVGLLTIDPSFGEYAGSHLEEVERRKLAYLPDPAPDLALPPKVVARERLGIPQDAKVVLAYGMLSERKGIFQLIECASSSNCPSNIHVLLAGEQSQEVIDFLSGEASSFLRKQGRLTISSGYILDSEAAGFLAAADCMWVGYRGFYMMSAVLVLAARHGIPCIVSDCGVAGYIMRQEKFGLAIDPDHRDSVLSALEEISRDRSELAIKGRRAMTGFSRHSVAEFQRTISTMVLTAGSFGGSESNGN